MNLKLFASKKMSRRFSFQVVIGILLVGLIIFQISFFSESPFDHLKFTALQDFNNPQQHLRLAQYAAGRSDWKLAQQMLEKATSLLIADNQKRVAGIDSDFEQITREIFPESVIQSKIDYWEEIVEQYPTYRDGYLRLALLNLRLNKNEIAQRHFYSAYTIDPNNGAVAAVGRLFQGLTTGGEKN